MTDLEKMLVGQDSGHPLDSPMTRQEVLEVLTGFRQLVQRDTEKLLERWTQAVRELVVEELEKRGLGEEGGESWAT